MALPWQSLAFQSDTLTTIPQLLVGKTEDRIHILVILSVLMPLQYQPIHLTDKIPIGNIQNVGHFRGNQYLKIEQGIMDQDRLCMGDCASMG